MNYRFTAATPAAALAQIHSQLGPDAVVLSVRRLPPQGLARLWPASGAVEVIATVPDPSAPSNTPSFNELESHASAAAPSGSRWKTVSWLESMGLLPANAARLQTRLTSQYPTAPASLEDEWAAVSALLETLWIEASPAARPPSAGPRPHVFIGPPGSGKTTVLCKWLTLAVLTEARRARVWRLDGSTANTSEFLGIHCEMLDTPLERFWSGNTTGSLSEDLQFIDLPGVDFRDSQSVAALRDQLATFSNPHVHLVLNAAYETSALLSQWNAFAPFKPEDLIFTHLDEELRRVKLWNFVLHPTHPIRHLSAGHRIPGDFLRAVPALLFPSASCPQPSRR